ncbi:hypothetical protein PCIT_a4435 [Pseudoalteromonas citrea]|uniref:Uncharacterized protein n=1 Tax=Pseudoalteromonas citrea TaxID=43655 RepID=A0AAD4AG65_9GAMM|nr:hypothetical protein PCIT_a4435 [Pseudoalteromonas citrea]
MQHMVNYLYKLWALYHSCWGYPIAWLVYLHGFELGALHI